MRRVLVCLLATASYAGAQWIQQESHSTAGLRGVHSLAGGIAWASGTAGTILRTVDGGENWTRCATPAGAEKLDFRAVQGFNSEVALAMSAGTGDLSRVYKTTDGCRSWRLVLSNPDAQGFWDALMFAGPDDGVLIGDPVEGAFPVFVTADRGETWKRQSVPAEKNQSLFAASNSSIAMVGGRVCIVTGGGMSAFIEDGVTSRIPLAEGEAAGGFAVTWQGGVFVAVGGDYKKPDDTSGTAAFRGADGVWHAAEVPPHGYRSAVAYDETARAWIAVGPNGSDLSFDGGRTWKPMADGGKDWNAISLPFAVGSRGRICKLRDIAIQR